MRVEEYEILQQLAPCNPQVDEYDCCIHCGAGNRYNGSFMHEHSSHTAVCPWVAARKILEKPCESQ